MNAGLSWRAKAASLVLVAGVAACSSGGSGSVTSAPPSSRTSSTPAPSAASAAKQAAIDSALGAYAGYREALNDALRRGDPRSKRLGQFAADKALAEARGNLLQLKGFGIVYTGEPSIEPTASRVALDDPRPTVDIVDCVDNSKWIPVYKASGKSAAAPRQNQRVPLNAQVQFFNGAWRVMYVKSDRSIQC